MKNLFDPQWSSLSIMQKCLVAGLLCFTFALLGLYVVLDGYYCQTRPRIPRPTEGRIYQDTVCHGADVYLTKREYFIFQLMLPVMAVSGMTAFYFFNRWGRRSNLRELKPPQ
jgi:hypothetical protein